jgi:hypothetical protein
MKERAHIFHVELRFLKCAEVAAARHEGEPCEADVFGQATHAFGTSMRG